MSKQEPSEFAAALRKILDGPVGFSRSDWARILWVTPAAISHWLADRTLPRAEILRSIVDTIRNYGSAEAMANFETLAGKRAETISPLGARMEPTVAHYMVAPLRESFLRLLGTLKPKHQEVVLFAAAKHCRSLREDERFEARPPSQLRDAMMVSGPRDRKPVRRQPAGFAAVSGVTDAV
jgi:hypothetical protein